MGAKKGTRATVAHLPPPVRPPTPTPGQIAAATTRERSTRPTPVRSTKGGQTGGPRPPKHSLPVRTTTLKGSKAATLGPWSPLDAINRAAGPIARWPSTRPPAPGGTFTDELYDAGRKNPIMVAIRGAIRGAIAEASAGARHEQTLRKLRKLGVKK